MSEQRLREALEAYMFCEQTDAGKNPHPPGTNRHRAFELGKAALASTPVQPAPAAFDARADARAYAHKAMDRVQEMRKLDLERARDTNLQHEKDYYLGRAHRCDDILFWLSELESHVPAGQAAQEKQRTAGLEERVAFYREFIEACKSGEAEPDDEHEHGWFHGRRMLAEDFVKELTALLDEDAAGGKGGT